MATFLVPAKRRASSLAKSRLAIFDWPYIFHGE